MPKTDDLEASANSREEFGKRLTKIYEDMGLTRKLFAEQMGVKYETMRAYERGRAEPPSAFFIKLSDIYPTTDIKWLITGVPSQTELMPGALPVRKIPVVTTIPASGFETGIPDELVIDEIFTANLKDPSLFALLVKGDSMAPEINEGDYALCAPAMDFINGKVYAVVAHDYAASLKRVFKTDGGWTLIPANTKFKSIVVPDEKLIKLYKVVQVTRKY